MRFQTIRIVGGQADLPDPRANPELVPEQAIKASPAGSLAGTDEQPRLAAITLEGTAGQTVDVEPFVLEETSNDDRFLSPEEAASARAARRFYSLDTTPVTVTVGAVELVRVVPGPIYYRLTSAPLADAVLKIGFVAGQP